MPSFKVLFRIPLTVYWICWEKDVKKICIAEKFFKNGDYLFRRI